ncbi:MAG: Bifunctional oligoribonuclease and PAP phosphatase NrnA [bacterium ADurb.Bin400]|nr:MAG: Bifunctional oligoribonuclease and PAP phosphatase NrnA [bacterium ADurb.Bin400]
MNAFQKFKTIIEERNSFLIVCHERADGDSIGSLLALGEVLDSLGKQAVLVSSSGVPPVFRFLKGSDKIKQDFLLGDFEAVILVDNGDFHRTGFADRLAVFHKKRIPLINIDHHPKNDLWRISTVNYVDTNVSSTCELIYSIITQLGVEITPTLATSLLTGIYTDTAGFQHTNTSSSVLEVSSALLRRGAKLKQISANVSNSRSVTMLKLWGIALSRLSFNHDLGMAYSVLTKDDIESVGASEDEVSGLVNLINAIPNSRIALLLYETKDGRIKGSLRTESDNVDLSRLANYFGGGGHRRASGFSLSGRLRQDAGIWRAV